MPVVEEPQDPFIREILDEANGWLAKQGLEMTALVAHPMFKVITALSAEHAVRTGIEEQHNDCRHELTAAFVTFRNTGDPGLLVRAAQRWLKV